MLNENGIHNILVDVEFLEDEFKRAGRPQLMSAFDELRAVSYTSGSAIAIRADLGPRYQIASIVLNNNVQQFLTPAIRQSTYAHIRAKPLQSMLEKLARFGGQCRDPVQREKGEKRRKEAEAIGKIYPVETR